jgi:hypothetical protein
MQTIQLHKVIDVVHCGFDAEIVAEAKGKNRSGRKTSASRYA